MSDVTFHKRFGWLLFWGLFFGLAFLTAWLVTRAVYRFGILIEPKILIYAAMFGLMFVLAFVYLRAWRGFLLRRFAATPAISLKHDVIGFQATTDPFICKTFQGYRATFEIQLPYGELTNRERITRRLLRILFRQEIVSVAYFEGAVPARQYQVDEGTEPQLQKLMQCENARLRAIPARGPIRMHVCVSVPDPETARALHAEDRRIVPIPVSSFAGGFFQPGLFDQPGAITQGEIRTARVPAFMENQTGRFLPLLVTGYEKGYAHRAHHDRLQGLQQRLQRPVLWHALTFAYPKRELTRIKRVAALENAYPKNLLDAEAREAIGGVQGEIETFKRQLRSARKPRLLKHIVWIKLEEEDQARVLFRAAQEHLFEHRLLTRALNPSQALSLFASLHPGLEKLSADVSQGLGIGGEEEEISQELEALSQWPGHEEAHQILEDFSGKTVHYNLFEGGNNYNLIIVGESGSGKSVVINGITAAHLARSRYNRAILVDYGGSFTGLVQAVGGRQISYADRGRIKISPIPTFAPLLSKQAFAGQYPGEDFQTYLADHGSLRTELRKQALVLIRDYLCKVPVQDNAVFQEVFFEFLEKRGVLDAPLPAMIGQGIEDAGQCLNQPHPPIRERAYRDLRDLLLELDSKVKICPFLGETRLDLKEDRLTSFNLDGFGPDDKNILVGLISLLIQQIFGMPMSGNTLVVFDEVHKFIREENGSLSPLAHVLDGTQRVTRKYGASLVLASQSPEDYEQIPSLIKNANHHCVMRLKMKELSPEWKLTNPDLIEHARTKAEPAGEAGFSTLHLGTTAVEGDLQGKFKYRFTPIALYAFTSKLGDKNLMRLACHLTGIPDFLTLAIQIHEDHCQNEKKPMTKLIPIGSPAFFNRLKPLILPQYHLVRDALDDLFRDPRVNPFLDAFLHVESGQFENMCQMPSQFLT